MSQPTRKKDEDLSNRQIFRKIANQSDSDMLNVEADLHYLHNSSNNVT